MHVSDFRIDDTILFVGNLKNLKGGRFMIKNLKMGLPEFGKIKAGTKGEEIVSTGGKKFRLPKKLNHYIVTTTERDEDGNFMLDNELMDNLKKSGAILDTDKNIVGIPIRLLYNSIDLDFHTRYAAYVGGKCVCSGDGEKGRTRDGRDVKCPCKQQDNDYEGKDKCKANGRLICLIDGAPVVGACHILRTTSINTVKSILASLAFIQTAASGNLAFLPLHLILKPKTTSIPGTGQPVTVYVSSIIYRGSIESLRKDALGMAKDKAQYLIAMDTVEESARELLDKMDETEQEQADIQQEFYPDSVDAEIVESPVEPKKEKPAEKKPEKKPETKKEPAKTETKTTPETPPETTPEPEPELITTDQKKKIVALKKENKITNPETWANLLKPFNVKSAVDMTFAQAEQFIEVLKKNPF